MRILCALTAAIALSAGVLYGTAHPHQSHSQSQPPSASSDTPLAYAFAEPGISPDGREIAFSSGGDIWAAPATGGEARLLVADPATDRRPLYSPDGRALAFVSTRTGGGDIYVLDLANGDVRRLTWDDGLEQLDGWSRDGTWIYFSSTSRDIAGMNDIFRVASSGGTPLAVTAERYTNEFGAAASPDGARIAFVARGIASEQWWRKGSSHIDQSELWVRELDDDGGLKPADYVQVAVRDARVMWPMWSGDGRALFYVSDRGGVENVWTRPPVKGGAERRITSFTTGRVLWPSSTLDARTIAFERDFSLWTLDTATGQTREVPIRRRGTPMTQAPERVRQTNQFSGLALAPDGRKLAFVARGDLFAVSRDGGDATRLTATTAIENQPAWAPDSRRLAYVSASHEGEHIYLHDFTTGESLALTSGPAADISPAFSPDGRRLAYLRNRRELHVLEIATKTDRVVSTGTFADTNLSPKPVWSPDGKWIATFAVGTKAFTNVELVPSAGGTRVPVSFLANRVAKSIAWSADGTYLLFDTRQGMEKGQLARVDLILRTPKFREDLFNAPGTRQANPEPGSLNPDPVFTDIRQRLALLPTGLDVGNVTVSRDGKTAAILAAAAGLPNLYAWPLDDLATEQPVARQVTTTAAAKSDAQFLPDGREVMFLEGGRIQIANIDRRDARPLNVTAEFTADPVREREAVFDQAWTLLRDSFFDASFRGVDWERSRVSYGQRAASAATADELRRVINLMVGDLNASHLGIWTEAVAPVIGRVGLGFDRREYERSGRLVVTGIVPLGPAALTGTIGIGDVLTAVNGRSAGAGAGLDELLAHTIGKRVVLTFAGGAGGPSRDVAVRPVSQTTEKALVYREWVERNREYVLKASGGRLGYVHMIDMTTAAFDQLLVDLDTTNHQLDGVVVDLRNNTGDVVSAYALDVFARQPYLRMGSRAVPEAPGRGVMGQRALEAPTVLIVNQHSMSDAENFTEGYRTLKLGPVVGEPTAGWDIWTADVPLVDGSMLGVPRIRMKAADGGDMEMVPRKVDVTVTRKLGESAAGIDTQLDEAIRTLLRRLGRAE